MGLLHLGEFKYTALDSDSYGYDLSSLQREVSSPANTIYGFIISNAAYDPNFWLSLLGKFMTFVF